MSENLENRCNNLRFDYAGMSYGLFYPSGLSNKETLHLSKDYLFMTDEKPIDGGTNDGVETGSTAIYQKAIDDHKRLIQLRRDYLVEIHDSNRIAKRRIVLISPIQMVNGNFPEVFENLSDKMDSEMQIYCEDRKLIPKGWINLMPYQNLEF